MDDISIKTKFMVMSCKSILLLLFLLPCQSNMMDMMRNRNDNHTHHNSPNYYIHCRRVALVVRLTQEMYIKQRFQQKFIWLYEHFLLFRIDLGHINDNRLVTGMKTIWAKSHCYTIYMQDGQFMDIVCVQLKLMPFIYHFCFVSR